MTHFWKDFGRGLLYAVPVLAVAGLGAREVIRLRAANHELEAQRLAAERALARVEEQLAARNRMDDQSLATRLRAAAEAAETQGAAEERLTRVVEFLKQEVSTAETTIEALRRGEKAPGTSAPATASGADATTASLLREIARLNAEIEALRSRRSTDP
jgi:hypothetical protein